MDMEYIINQQSISDLSVEALFHKWCWKTWLVVCGTETNLHVHFMSNPEIITNPQNKVVVSCLLGTYLNLKTGFKN